MKTIVEEWPANENDGAVCLAPGIKFFTKEMKNGRRRSRPHLVYLFMNDNPPVDLSEVEMFTDLIQRESTGG